MTHLNICILTQYFPPETGAPQARLGEMALHLAVKGHKVTILTAMPNYPQGIVHDAYRGKWIMQDEWQGLRVIRSFIYPSKSAKLLPRLMNYFSFVFSSAIAGLIHLKRTDVIVVESPPLFLGISGALLKIATRGKMVFNVSDLWPETAVALGLYTRDSGFVRMAAALEKQLYAISDALTGQSHGIVAGIQAIAPHKPVTLVPNGCDTSVFRPDVANETYFVRHGIPAEKTIIGYAGLIGLAQGIGVILDAARAAAARTDLHFVIVGDGPEKESLEKDAADLTNVTFTGLVQKTDMPSIVAAFDMTIIPLKTHIPGALPSKMYEAMASAVPIILPAEGDPKTLLEKAQCGVAVSYDGHAIADACIALADDAAERQRLGQNGRAYVLAHHERKVIAQTFENALLSAFGQETP